MAEHQFNQLTINGECFTKQSLVELSHKELSQTGLPDWKQDFFSFILSWLDDSDGITLSTSGSTGEPKKLRAGKSEMVESAVRTGRYLNLRAGQTALLALPVRYIAGQMMVVRAFVLGLNLVPVIPSSEPLTDDRTEYDFAALTPMQVIKTLEADGGIEKITSVKNLIIGGGTVSRELNEQLKGLKNQIWSTYGMTETLTHVAMKKITEPNPASFFDALPGIYFGTDNRGCLVIYLPGSNNEGIITNDLVTLKSKTTFEYIGRFDNLINSGGIKISPEWVEGKLARALNKQRFIVTGIPDRLLGHKPVLVIEGEMDDTMNIRDLAKQSGLNKYEIPKDIFFIEHFPETENGKIIRRKVQDLLVG